MSSNMSITIGCDPELFVFNLRTGQPVSAHDIVPGNKFNPVIVPRGAIQADGTAAEFNIRPAKNIQQWLESIRKVRGVLDSIISMKNKDYGVIVQPTVTFEEDYFNGLPDQAVALGCQPDWDAYTGCVNPKPSTTKPFRTAAGHVHIGWTANQPSQEEVHFKQCCDLVKELDFVLYNSSLLWDKDEERRTLYGKPGAFRPKPYGLEYRVLSNAWLSSQKTQEFVFIAAKAVASKFFRCEAISEKFEGTVSQKEEDFKRFETFLMDNHLPAPCNYFMRNSK